MRLAWTVAGRAVGIAVFALLTISTADLFAVTIAWSPVGDAGNAADPATGFGAVGYDYKIGTYDVTNAQYTEFLNARDPNGANTLGLYDTLGRSFGSANNGISFSPGNPVGSKYAVITGFGNHPANFVNWYSTIRFANWMNNGQGNADTESGAYTLLGGTPVPSNGGAVTRNGDARIVLPSENEWYKAAYFDSSQSSYFKFATGSNTAPSAVAPPGGTNSANYNGAIGPLTDVGAYALSLSPYSTFDQTGNVEQWTEALGAGSSRIYRGGSYAVGPSEIGSNARHSFSASGTGSFIGFRLATVPEPSSFWLASLGAVVFLLRWKRAS